MPRGWKRPRIVFSFAQKKYRQGFLVVVVVVAVFGAVVVVFGVVTGLGTTIGLNFGAAG